MTVSELIAKLQEVDGSIVVGFLSRRDDPDDLETYTTFCRVESVREINCEFHSPARAIALDNE